MNGSPQNSIRNQLLSEVRHLCEQLNAKMVAIMLLNQK